MKCKDRLEQQEILEILDQQEQMEVKVINVPCGNAVMKSCALASLAAASTLSRRA